jgi:hypothetical protein
MKTYLYFTLNFSYRCLEEELLCITCTVAIKEGTIVDLILTYNTLSFLFLLAS